MIEFRYLRTYDLTSGKHLHRRLLISIGSPLAVTVFCESQLQNLIFTGLEPHGLPCRKTHAQGCEVIPLSLKAIYAQLQNTLRFSQVSRVDLIYASGKHLHRRLLIRIGSPLPVTVFCESQLQNLIFTGLEPHGLPSRKTHAQGCEVLFLSLKAIYAQLQNTLRFSQLPRIDLIYASGSKHPCNEDSSVDSQLQLLTLYFASRTVQASKI